MSADVERALLVLIGAVVDAERVEGGVDGREPHEAQELRLEDFGTGPELDAIRATTLPDAIGVLAAAVGHGSGADTTAGVQGLVLGTRLARAEAGVDSDELGELANALLASVGAEDDSEDAIRAGALVAAARDLLDAEVRIDAARDGLTDAFAGRLRIDDSLLSEGMRTLSGPATPLVAQLVDLTNLYSGVACSVQEYDLPGTPPPDPVTSVVIETCTALPWETCRQRIDPERWPDCNPYFDSVAPIEPCAATTGPTGWYGSVKERVGPGLNLKYYETDLGIRYVERNDIAAASFKLAKIRHDDGCVTWDTGFLSVIDEGTHRRIQMAKDYRIIDLQPPLDWVCPLWASQFVVSGWACSCADTLRRALRAWSSVTRTVLWTTEHVCEGMHCDHPDHRHHRRARRSRVPVLDLETFELPASYDCPPSSVRRGGVRVPLPAPPPNTVAPSTAQLLTPESGVLTPTPVEIQPVGAAASGGTGSVVEVQLPVDAAPGLYFGAIKDATGHETPYTIYVSDVP